MRFTDIEVQHHGATVLVRPISTAGRGWVEAIVGSDETLAYCGAVPVEGRDWPAWRLGMLESGLHLLELDPERFEDHPDRDREAMEAIEYGGIGGPDLEINDIL